MVRSSPEREVRVRALALTLTMPLSTQDRSTNGYRKIVGKPNKLPGNDLPSRPGGVEILLAASCYRNRG